MRGTPSVLKEFHGLNLADDPLGLSWGTAGALANVEPNGSVGLHRRAATVEQATLQVTPSFLAPTSAAIGLMYYGSGKWYSTLSTTALQTGFTDSLGRGLDAPITSTTIGFFITSQFDGPFYWDGLSASLTAWTATSGTTPSAGFIAYQSNRMLMAKCTASPNARIKASKAGDVFNWATTTGNGWTVDVEANDGDDIMGLEPCGPYLLLLKRKSIHVIYDLDTGANRPLTRAHGCHTTSCSITLAERCYFVSHDGVYSTDGNSVQLHSAPLGNVVFQQDATYRLTGSWPFLAMTIAGDGVYVLDLRSNEWWKHTFGNGIITPNLWPNEVGEGTTPFPRPGFFVLRGAGTAKTIDTWNPHHEPYVPTLAADGTTSPTTFTSSWTSGAQDFGRPGVRKRIRSLTVTGTSPAGVLTARLNPDGATATGQASGLGLTDYSTKVLPTWGVGRIWQLNLADTSTSRWAVHELEIDWQTRRA